MNSLRSSRSAKPSEFRIDGDEVGLAGLVDLDEADAQHRARLVEALAQAHEPRALGAQVGLQALELGALGVEVDLDDAAGAPAASPILPCSWRMRRCSRRSRVVSDALGALLAADLRARLVDLATAARRAPAAWRTGRTTAIGSMAHSASGSATAATRTRTRMRRRSLGSPLRSDQTGNRGLWSLASALRTCAGAAPRLAGTPASPARRFARMDPWPRPRPHSNAIPGLQARMLLTMFLLGALYVVVRRRAVRRPGASGPTDPADLRRPRAVPALHVRQARAARDGRARGHAAGGARAARDDRAPVHPGRPAQAEDRRRPDRACPTPSRSGARRRARRSARRPGS